MNDTLPPTSNRTRSRKRPVVIGVTAGLLAGGAIGLVATMPAITSAASDDVVAFQEGSEDGTDSTDERPEPGEHLREALQPLVDAGTIDAVQADAVTEHLVEIRPERGDRPGHRRRGLDGHGPANPVLANLLGIDREMLRAEIMAGNSVADIAAANGVDVQTVIDGLIADAGSHIDLAIAHGMDEEDAAERLERISERIEEGVYLTRPTDG